MSLKTSDKLTVFSLGPSSAPNTIAIARDFYASFFGRLCNSLTYYVTTLELPGFEGAVIDTSSLTFFEGMGMLRWDDNIFFRINDTEKGDPKVTDHMKRVMYECIYMAHDELNDGYEPHESPFKHMVMDCDDTRSKVEYTLNLYNNRDKNEILFTIGTFIQAPK